MIDYEKTLCKDSIKCIGILLVISAIAFFIFVVISPASAETIVVKQGDTIYMNETVDLAEAVTWPDYALAWWQYKNNDDTPDQVITITKNMHSYFIDPSVFHYGTYYRWDGEWHRGENAVAFTISPGKRSDKGLVINKTDVIENQVEIKETTGPFSYIIAKGDSVNITTVLDKTDDCHLWVFTGDYSTYNIPMDRKNGSIYHAYSANIPSDDIYRINTGEYSGYIQCNGNNNVQDIFTSENSYGAIIYNTPFKNINTEIIDIFDTYHAKEQFDSIIRSMTNPVYDDTFYPVNLSVREPQILITSVEINQYNTKMYIDGYTTWADNTSIEIKLDPDHYALAADISLHTWVTYASGTQDNLREIHTSIPIDTDEMTIGSHEITFRAIVPEVTAYTSYVFKISDYLITPTPTPETRRGIYTSSYSEMKTRNDSTVTETTTVVNTTAAANTTINSTATSQGIVSIANDTGPAIITPDYNADTSSARTSDAGKSNGTENPAQNNIAYTIPVPLWLTISGIFVAIFFRRKL